ncbi:MAG: hypothetical protein KA982_03215 [Clostridia bacterium]|nr:hypothetical protein [Clostridia bacterium]MDD4501803.1 hypothetical protein [Clostridia bacterium]HQO69498.1 hypothetical protein [Clostridia bacterium]
MKNRIWILVIVLLIVSIGAASGFCIGRSMNRIADNLNKPIEAPDVDKGTFSMFAKMGISNDQLSGYSSVEEAILNIDKPIRVENVGFTSEEVTAMMNISKEYLQSMYINSIEFNMQPDNTVHFDIYIDGQALKNTANLPDVAVSVLSNTKFTLYISIEGVSPDGKLMLKINDIYVKDVHVMNFINLFNLGGDVRSFVSQYIGQTISLELPMLKDLKSFTISDGLAYIDGTFTNIGATVD